ncbi:HAD family phosphatase [Amycolatopsis sp. YIM 10]|uniref:HAD family phosphatase n=1 Tax=Amycolatopsis sp. YIM 10 TaxID=2653857 RepID=UPI0012905345|nr:HAD family phosphatase [Amycolatopsis sp. YIM 10]QFU86815.1 hypothetical protein YIM_08020 [Amycolatopsis sp. YIM 10]
MVGTVLLFDLTGPQSAEGRSGAPSPDLWDAYWTLRPPGDRGSGYWRMVAKLQGTRFDDRRFERLVAADIAGWSGVDETMVGLIAELVAQGRRVALLSTIPEEPVEHAWSTRFEVRLLSYRWCLRALRVPPDRVLFTDDRQDNVLAAEAAGMRVARSDVEHLSLPYGETAR